MTRSGAPATSGGAGAVWDSEFTAGADWRTSRRRVVHLDGLFRMESPQIAGVARSATTRRV